MKKSLEIRDVIETSLQSIAEDTKQRILQVLPEHINSLGYFILAETNQLHEELISWARDAEIDLSPKTLIKLGTVANKCYEMLHESTFLQGHIQMLEELKAITILINLLQETDEAEIKKALIRLGNNENFLTTSQFTRPDTIANVDPVKSDILFKTNAKHKDESACRAEDLFDDIDINTDFLNPATGNRLQYSSDGHIIDLRLQIPFVVTENEEKRNVTKEELEFFAFACSIELLRQELPEDPAELSRNFLTYLQERIDGQERLSTRAWLSVESQYEARKQDSDNKENRKIFEDAHQLLYPASNEEE